jgi:hypothetical protein
MVSKCANPGCSASFRYFREGRLFEIEVTSMPKSGPADAQRKPHRKVEYFWLCSSCATRLIVKVDDERGVITAPLVGTAVRHATA